MLKGLSQKAPHSTLQMNFDGDVRFGMDSSHWDSSQMEKDGPRPNDTSVRRPSAWFLPAAQAPFVPPTRRTDSSGRSSSASSPSSGRAELRRTLPSPKLAQLETPIARYKPGQKEKSGNSCCFQHIDHLFLGHHHHITGTPSQNDQGTIKT